MICRTFCKKSPAAELGRGWLPPCHSKPSSSTSIYPQSAQPLSLLSNCLSASSDLCHCPPVCYLSPLSCSSLPMASLTSGRLHTMSWLLLLFPPRSMGISCMTSLYPVLCYLWLFSRFRIGFLLSLGPNTFLFFFFLYLEVSGF